MTQIAVEGSSYVPSKRDEIVMQLRRGEKKREEAEAWAIENNEPPFIAKPDPARFDPMTAADWTLAMALAWIIWRTPEAVRKHWDAYLFECKEWRAFEAIYPDGRRDVGWEARQCQPVSLADIARECAKVDPDDSKLNEVASIESLWSAIKTGQLEATGIPHWVGGLNGIPFIRSDIARAAPRRVVIPRPEFIDLSPVDFHVGLPDSIATATDHEARYDEVRVWRDDVLRIWKSPEIARNEDEPVTASTIEEMKPVETHTGFAGRPTAKHLIAAEFKRMVGEGRTGKTLAGTAKVLEAWFLQNHKTLPPPTAGTIENNIRAAYRAAIPTK